MSDEIRRKMRLLLEEARRSGALPAALEELRSFLGEEAKRPTAKGAGERFGIIGISPPMVALFERIEKILASSYPVLIHGESGTGKELVARALHHCGPRKGKPFFSTNCAAIPETLLEAELFGHKKGAFTGAVADRKGHFVAADGGTLFLDEIGDMSPAMQTKLLRVLEDGEVRPVGATNSLNVNVRVIAASNRRLQDLVAAGKFRQDLFFRLNVLTVELPPLRERKEDIPLLVSHFAAKVGREMGKEVRVTEAALARLVSHGWPGNVRELENEIRRGAALSGGRIDAGDLRTGLGESP